MGDGIPGLLFSSPLLECTNASAKRRFNCRGNAIKASCLEFIYLQKWILVYGGVDLYGWFIHISYLLDKINQELE